ncbi:ABC transporter substrate-binding protein [Cohnella algarum]|nr:ABC transporter substrate-binding protein [Cohnella algarum]
MEGQKRRRLHRLRRPLPAAQGLETVGLEESDVQIMNMNNNLAGSTFMAGQVDAAVTWEPYLSEATAKGGRVLYSTKDAPNLIVDAVVVKKSLIDNYPEQVRKMVEAFDEGLAMFNEGDEGKQIVADELGMDVPSLVSTVETLELTTAEGSEKMLVDDRAAWEETMKEYADFFVSQKILTETVDTTGIINDFLYK